MNDVNPDVRRLVDLARKARTPGSDAKHRVAERLAVPLAAGIAAGTAAGAAKAAAGVEIASAAGAKAATVGLFSSVGVKLAAVIAVGAAAAALVVGRVDSRPSPAPAASQRVIEPVRPALPEAVTSENDVSPLPPLEEAPAPADSAAPRKAQAAPSVHAEAHDLVQEAALLHEAQSAWRAGDSAKALSLANQHAQQFPRSPLANERDVLRVLSLCKLGQVHAARQVGARLLRSAKGSPWYQSVADSCAAK
jgi:hypothetical protein